MNYKNLRDRVLNLSIKISDIRSRININKKYKNQKNILTESQKDMIRERWGQFNVDPTSWINFYFKSTMNFDLNYIPHDYYYTKIDRFFNNRKYVHGIKGKNYLPILFPQIQHPLLVGKKINNILFDSNSEFITKDKFICHCLMFEELIVKPSIDSGGGKNIFFWQREKDKNGTTLLDIIDRSENIVIQQVIIQHPDLKKLNDTSINTIRIITLIFKGKVHILSSVMRIGMKGSRVDNASAGGITCGIKPNGYLKDVAYNLDGKKYEQHPNGVIFSQHRVPKYEEIKSLAINMQKNMAHFRMISWDFAVDSKEEPILIEANFSQGEITMHQLNNGPLFSDLTDDVLKLIFERRN